MAWRALFILAVGALGRDRRAAWFGVENASGSGAALAVGVVVALVIAPILAVVFLRPVLPGVTSQLEERLVELDAARAKRAKKSGAKRK